MISCVICKEGTMSSGKVTVTLERKDTILIVKEVPATVCQNCGEYLLSSEITEKLMNILSQAVKQGAAIEMIKYAA